MDAGLRTLEQIHARPIVRLDAVVILTVFAKKTRRTPVRQIEARRDRLRHCLRDIGAR